MSAWDVLALTAAGLLLLSLVDVAFWLFGLRAAARARALLTESDLRLLRRVPSWGGVTAGGLGGDRLTCCRLRLFESLKVVRREASSSGFPAYALTRPGRRVLGAL